MLSYLRAALTDAEDDPHAVPAVIDVFGELAAPGRRWAELYAALREVLAEAAARPVLDAAPHPRLLRVVAGMTDLEIRTWLDGLQDIAAELRTVKGTAHGALVHGLAAELANAAAFIEHQEHDLRADLAAIQDESTTDDLGNDPDERN